MKKSKIFAVILSAAMLLSGCAQESGNASNESKSGGNSSQSEEKSSGNKSGGEEKAEGQDNNKAAADTEAKTEASALGIDENEDFTIENTHVIVLEKKENSALYALYMPVLNNLRRVDTDTYFYKKGTEKRADVELSEYVSQQNGYYGQYARKWAILRVVSEEDTPISDMDLVLKASSSDSSLDGKFVFNDWDNVAALDEAAKRELGIFTVEGIEVLPRSPLKYAIMDKEVGYGFSLEFMPLEMNAEDIAVTDDFVKKFRVFANDGTELTEHLKANYNEQGSMEMSAYVRSIGGTSLNVVICSTDNVTGGYYDVYSAHPYVEYTNDNGEVIRINLYLEENK